MADNNSLDLEEIYEFAVELGKEAGAMLMKAAEARFGGVSESNHTEKDNAVDLVTQTDIGEWKMFITRLSLRCSIVKNSTRNFVSTISGKGGIDPQRS
jgi:myo-inositol-1(or 4)-monophosphatase